MTGNFSPPLKKQLPALVLLAPLLLSACNETTAATMRPSSDQNPQLQLLGRVNSLESEVANLRNTVDVQADELNRLRERLSSIYDDIDQRLQGLETGSSTGAFSAAPAAEMMRDFSC
jgi:TolA-binding protein